MKDYRYVIGIDPGADGAFAIIDMHGHVVAYRFLDDHALIIRELPRYLLDAYIVIENVHALYGSSADSTFGFGKNVGRILGILEAFGAEPHIDVQPKEWQKHTTLGVTPPVLKGLDKAVAKRLKAQHKLDLKLESMRAAFTRHPNADLFQHDGVCDAVNIAHYGLLRLTGKIEEPVMVKKASKKKAAKKVAKKVAPKAAKKK